MSSSEFSLAPDARIEDAQASVQAGQFDQAEKTLLSTVRDHPSSFRAWVTLGLLYQHMG